MDEQWIRVAHFRHQSWVWGDIWWVRAEQSVRRKTTKDGEQKCVITPNPVCHQTTFLALTRLNNMLTKAAKNMQSNLQSQQILSSKHTLQIFSAHKIKDYPWNSLLIWEKWPVCPCFSWYFKLKVSFDPGRLCCSPANGGAVPDER